MHGGKYKLAGLLRGFFTDLLEFVYPPRCGLCGGELGREERVVCAACWRDLDAISAPFCPLCGISLSRPAPLCPSCGIRRHCFSFARSHALFDPGLQKIIHMLKYGRKRSLAEPLAGLMATVMSGDSRFENMDALVPVPLHPIRLRVRGYNQSELLASKLSRITGLPVQAGALIRTVNTNSQAKLNLRQRTINVRKAFRIRACQRVKNRRIVLVDDVLTTGATVDACAAALLDAGAAEISVITMARAAEPGTAPAP